MFAGLESPTHLIIVLVVVLLLFGAKRIPEFARGLGEGVREFQRGAEGADEEKARGKGRLEAKAEGERSAGEAVGDERSP